MSRTLVEKLDDAINPIVVKEIRQAVRSRVIAGILMLFLLVQLVVMAFTLAAGGDGRRSDNLTYRAGREIFMVLQGFLLGTCMLVAPIYTWVRLAAERSDANVDLLFISTLKPRSIIWGKSFAAMVLMLMVFSACAPFMTFTYLLRGIDIPTILVILLLDALAVLASVQLAVFLAAVPASRFFKGLLGAGGFGGLIGIYFGAMGLSVSLIYEFAPDKASWEFWGPVLSVAVVILFVMALFFAWAVAMISPPAANRALPSRLVMLAMAIVTGIIFGVWSYLQRTLELIAVWTGLMVGLFLLQLVIAINEREHWAARIARTIPRFPPLRLPAFLLYSGSLGGILFAVVMLGLTALVTSIWVHVFAHHRTFGDLSELWVMLTLMGLYTYSYCLTAVFLRQFLEAWIKPGGTWVIAAILLIAGIMLPYVVLLLLFLGNWHYRTDYLWLLTNPFAGLFDEENRHVFLTFAAFWAVIATLLNLPWAVQQAARFRPFEPARTADKPEEASAALVATPEDGG